MRKLVEDSIDMMMQSIDMGSCSDCCDPVQAAFPEQPEEDDVVTIEGLKAYVKVAAVEVDLPDFSNLRERFEDKDFADSIKLVIKRKAMEKLKESVAAFSSLRIVETDPYIAELQE